MSVRGLGSVNQPQTFEREGGVICHDLTGFSNLTVDIVRELYRQRHKVTSFEPRPVILLAPDVLAIEFQVQIYASHPNIQRSIEKLAIVGSSFMMKHLTSMFLSYHAPSYPVQQFDDLASAEAWLLETRGLQSRA